MPSNRAHGCASHTERSDRAAARRGRSGRSLLGFICAAGVALTGVVAIDHTGGDDTASEAVQAVATDADVVAFSMIDFLEDDGGHSSRVVTMSDLRRDVLGSARSATGGAGVDVAVVDSGVAPVVGLTGDKVLHGPDLSYEGAVSEASFIDSYGHGTHIAGIIAGNRPGAEGLAPGARIVSVKVAGADGVTTVPQVVAAIDWVVQNRNVNGLDIRVLNLALGQAGVPSNQGDLLSAAVERAWNAGIFVVVAAGNRGQSQTHLDSPAISPFVLAVGASDSAGGDDDLDERNVPDWSARGNGSRDPDVVAPGRSIASYRVPGSTLDDNAPSAIHDGDFFKGSGSSQASAVVAGLAANLIARYPALTPDQVKDTIRYRTTRLEDVSSSRQGRGHVRGSSTLTNSPRTSEAPDNYGRAIPSAPASNAQIWSGGNWQPSNWNGASWSGASWSGASWSGASWSGASWSGASWSGASWSGASWSGASWSGASWSGASWSGSTWSGQGWS